MKNLLKLTVLSFLAGLLGIAGVRAAQTKIEATGEIIEHPIPPPQVRIVARYSNSFYKTTIWTDQVFTAVPSLFDLEMMIRPAAFTLSRSTAVFRYPRKSKGINSRHLGRTQAYNSPPEGWQIRVEEQHDPYGAWEEDEYPVATYYDQPSQWGPGWSRQTVEYRIIGSSALTGLKVRWQERFVPADESEPTKTSDREWMINGPQSPVFKMEPNKYGLLEVIGLEVVIPDMFLAVDANRDGLIKLASEDDSDATTAEKPYRFWLNDDDDFGDTSGDDIPNPSSSSDGAATTNFEGDGAVDGLRDLVDFFPVCLDIKDLLTAMPMSASVKYKLKHEDGALNFVYTKLNRTNARKYQTEDMGSIYGVTLNEPVTTAGTRRISATGVELSAQFLTGIKEQDWGVILVEGWLPTTKPLVLALEIDGTTIAEVKLQISISSIESMYRWINLRNVAGQPIARATNTEQPTNYPDSLTNGKMFVLLHGYNVNEDQSRGWGAESFKRLYWSGSHAMFALVSWHGDHSQIPYIGVAPDYWQNINYAFMTAQALPAAIHSLPGSSKVIAGHSMGNVVVSSAIADHGLSVSSYFMLDAAVALEAYDTAALSVDAMLNPELATYETRLWPTEWFNLFPSGDGRRGLTWRNRFGNLANATNFYSSGEDVLNNNDLTPGQVPSVGSERAWVLQEMVKGTKHIGAVLSFDVQGGWGFNSSWDIPTFVSDDSDAGGYFVYNRRTPAQAATLTDYQLRTQTFFGPFQDTRFVSVTAGSAAAAEYLPRADALGGAIPALSFAAGRNPVPLFGQVRNIDLMTKEDGWPRTGGRWFHSDAKNIAYRNNYPFWETWVELGDLK